MNLCAKQISKTNLLTRRRSASPGATAARDDAFDTRPRRHPATVPPTKDSPPLPLVQEAPADPFGRGDGEGRVPKFVLRRRGLTTTINLHKERRYATTCPKM